MRNSAASLALILIAASAAHAGAAKLARTPQSGQITVPVGTHTLVRMVNSIDSSKNKVGDRSTTTLETNLMAVDTVAVPKGATVCGRLANASSGGRMSGSSQLTLELTDIVINGTA